MAVNSILITGHSNSGKSPLGDIIEKKLSNDNRQFLHLDFGRLLRSVSRNEIYTGLSSNDIIYIKSILNGTLLDPEHYYLAGNLIDYFLNYNNFGPESDTLLLNGFPRNLSQTEYLNIKNINVKSLIFLDCSVREAVLRKKNSESGRGHEDRSDRNDGNKEIFNKKTASFLNDTMPLIVSCQKRGVPLIRVEVNNETTPVEVFEKIKSSL